MDRHTVLGSPEDDTFCTSYVNIRGYFRKLFYNKAQPVSYRLRLNFMPLEGTKRFASI